MKPLNEQAYDYLKGLIADSKLSYQEIYSETRLAKEIGISRTPLRDAIQRLAQEGYIDIIPSKGFRIHQLTKKDVADTFQIRSAIESYCTLVIAREAETRKAKKLFRELEFILGEMNEIMNTDRDISEFSVNDFLFHKKIVEYVDNEHFISVFETYIYRMKKLAELSLAHKGRMEDTCIEHANILEGMKKGDTENIYITTLEHMSKPQKINLDDLNA